PGSRYFGRLYVTYTKFHMTGGSYARSDYCPVQAAYTDAIPTADPAASSWGHTAIVPDAPGAKGTGSSANQFSTPLVDDQGALDVISSSRRSGSTGTAYGSRSGRTRVWTLRTI